jgi:Class III cytochrome C family
MRNLKIVALSCCSVLMILLLASGSALAGGKEQVVDKNHPHERTKEGVSKPLATCESCHTCTNPTRKDPCLVPCPRYEGYFHTDSGSDDGPDIVIIDQLADLYRPVIFAHKLHAEMSNMTGGCENCHHYSEKTGTIPPCRECHEPNSAAATLGQPALKGAYHRQCINCHMDWAHENACGFCHEQVDGTAIVAIPDSTDIIGVPHPKIEATATYTYETSCDEGPLVTFHHNDHVEMFGQQCVDCHQGDTCSRCHDTDKAKPHRLDHVTACITCHGERDCGFCHSEEAQPRFEHGNSTGWSLDPYHTGTACSTCHGDPKSFKHPETTCTNCHIHWEVGSFNHKVTGITLDENHIEEDCDSCHLDRNFTDAPSCDDCHDEAMFPEQLPGIRLGN